MVSLSVQTRQVSGEHTGPADIGITFTKGTEPSDKKEPRPSQDDTPTATKGLAINKQVRLPQTGETIKHFSLLVLGLMLVAMVFALALDQQIKGSDW